MQVNTVGMANIGPQGLLNMAFTQGNRFKQPLKNVEPKLNLKQTLKTEISNVLNSKNKQFQFLTDKFDYEALSKFEKPKSDKKFNKKDLRKFKTTNDILQILNNGYLRCYNNLNTADSHAIIPTDQQFSKRY